MKDDSNAAPFGAPGKPRGHTERDDPTEEPRTLWWLTPWWLAAMAVLLTVLLAG
jgi:hypothetical protein